MGESQAQRDGRGRYDFRRNGEEAEASHGETDGIVELWNTKTTAFGSSQGLYDLVLLWRFKTSLR